MKKLLLFSFIGISIGATAQINITTADVATPSKIILQANDTIPAVSIGAPGTNLTWNFSSLSDDKTDSLLFFPYSVAPNPNFSSANLLIKQGSQNFYSYAINNSSSFTILGNSGVIDFGGGPSQVNQFDTPAEILINFPTFYGSSFTNNFVQKGKFYFGVDPGAGFVIDSIRTRSVRHKTMVVDSWGSMTTPLGTYNTLRAREIVVQHDTSDAYVTAFGGWQNAVDIKSDSVASYIWWANGVGFPLVSARMDSLGNVKNVQWLLALPMAVGINEYTAPITMNVYPNPAQNEVNFAVNSGSVKEVQIYDIAGRKVDAFGVSADISSINISGYANGIYSFKVIGKDNLVLDRGKFSVAK
jgi:hypothetical protein